MQRIERRSVAETGGQDLGRAAQRGQVGEAVAHSVLRAETAWLDINSKASQHRVAAQQQPSKGAVETRAVALSDSTKAARNNVAQLYAVVIAGADHTRDCVTSVLSAVVFDHACSVGAP
jgi:hypothetical protein